MASVDIVTKRIHVGGLTPSITSSHIKDRFKSFGNVLQVEEMSEDGLGQARPFTFFTIQTTPLQLKKCLNIMSGSMWRGCQLRLAEAKPKYEIKLQKERNPTKEEVADRLRKRKRRVLTARGADLGKEAQDMRTPDEKNYKTKKFWRLDDSNHLVRPIAIRPTHALPPPVVASTSTSASTAKRRRGVSLKRSRIRVINPALWQPTHIGAEDLKSQSTDEEMEADGWLFESDEEGEEDEEGRKLVGRWIKNDGEEDEEVEEVWVQGRRVQDQGLEEEEESLGDFTPAENRDGSASPLFASHRPARSASPLFPGRQATTSPQPAEGDDMSRSGDGEEVLPQSAEEIVTESDALEEEVSAESPARSDKSASPLFPTRRPVSESKPAVVAKIQKAPVSDPISPPTSTKATQNEVTVAEPLTHILPDPVREVALAERSRDLGLLASFLGEEVSAPGKPTKGEWAGFDEDDEDDDEDIYPLRLRGGKADSDDEDMEESSSSDSSDDSDIDDDEESDDDEPDEVGNAKPNGASTSTVPVTKVEPAVKPAEPTPKPQSALKEMFAPAPTTSSFSLLGALDADIELDEELDIPLAPPPVYRTAEPEPELQPLSQSKKSHFDPDPSIPLFFPSFGKGGKDAMREETTGEGYVGFWKQETDEEMKEIWEKDKLELTRDWKKRYRDGKKQKKRRGGANDVE